MAQVVSVIVSEKDRQRLAAITFDRSRPLKHVQRADIILRSAERLNVLEVAQRVGISRLAVWRWQRRYAEERAFGLRRVRTHRFRRVHHARALARSAAMLAATGRGIATSARRPHRAVFDRSAAIEQIEVDLTLRDINSR